MSCITVWAVQGQKHKGYTNNMCSLCTRWVDHCRGRLCIWSDWDSLPLCSQMIGSLGRSSYPEGRSWFHQTHPKGQRIASGESADTETPIWT